MYRTYCRAFQLVMRMLSYLLPWRKPILIKGRGSLLRLPDLIRACGIHRVLIVTDKGIRSTGIMKDFLQKMEHNQIKYFIYDKTIPNPTIHNIEEALKLYYIGRCKGIVGFGGGSSMDCAKGVAARVARPDKSITQMKGLLKVMRKTPTLFAVPTTAGSGSESTLAAVVVDDETLEKYPINDFSLIPSYAVLDPIVTQKLPPHITATTGMDAFTHAVEVYIGRSNTQQTKNYSKMAIRLIYKNLYKAFIEGDNIAARERLQKAAYYAGAAFTRAYVGNIHAIAHTLGGFYSIPHGLANAVILPYVLEYYGYTVYQPLAELSDLIGLSQTGDNKKKKAERFIQEIRDMNKQMGIPEKIKGIEEKDISEMAKRACKEANPLYPVPMIFNIADFKFIYYCIKD
jgi:alcohol dehydrogenase